MARAVIDYDKDLPEISGRCPWEKPTSYLVKDDVRELGRVFRPWISFNGPVGRRGDLISGLVPAAVKFVVDHGI